VKLINLSTKGGSFSMVLVPPLKGENMRFWLTFFIGLVFAHLSSVSHEEHIIQQLKAWSFRIWKNLGQTRGPPKARGSYIKTITNDKFVIFPIYCNRLQNIFSRKPMFPPLIFIFKIFLTLTVFPHKSFQACTSVTNRHLDTGPPIHTRSVLTFTED
jgi:hypothetical protein